MGSCVSKRDHETKDFLEKITVLRTNTTDDASPDQITAAAECFATLMAETEAMRLRVPTEPNARFDWKHRMRIRLAQLHAVQCRLHARGVCDEPPSIDQRVENHVEEFDGWLMVWDHTHRRIEK